MNRNMKRDVDPTLKPAWQGRSESPPVHLPADGERTHGNTTTGSNQPSPHPLIRLHAAHGNQAVQRLVNARKHPSSDVTPPTEMHGYEAQRGVAHAEGSQTGSVPSVAQPQSIGSTPGVVVQRQDAGESRSGGGEYAEAAKKTGEAFLETELGKAIQERLKELGSSFLGTLAGKVFTGTAAAGAVSALVATNEELPVQPPEIPLDSLVPGLSVKLTYEGPVRNPTKAFVQFKYRFGAGAAPSTTPTARERRASETERLRRELHQFRESLKTPQQRAAEERIFWEMFMQRHRRSPFNPLNIPGLQPARTEPKGE